MKKNKKAQPKEETVDDIKIFWTKQSFWDDLTYEDKCRYYWEYKIVNGERVFDFEGKK